MHLAIAFSVLSTVLCTMVPQVQAIRSGVTCERLENPIEMAKQRCLCTPCHVCEYNREKKSCDFIRDNGIDLTDGSEAPSVQPTLEASEWFLTEEELTKSRRGVPRSDLQVFTTGNKVDVFPAGDTFFASVYQDVERSSADDTIYLAAWSTDDVPFDPINDPTGTNSSFKSIMSRAVDRGADFRALVWRNMLEMKQNIKMSDAINSLPKPV
ncbi:hypothetical protein Poli38472_012319 [Pythium oligandrum]|uniref:Uncharacterized protein n=1 Tax=Pythium oligandrum TaxID=41045 RepID=A0A8K1CQM9_PYTOL|nr:hypothetical protein Poli38472_012319 [Pythium oligandrum]|eukprot:TMW67203.1 hypothetical protein Poli38472_012319 [Pythium oligandrum]